MLLFGYINNVYWLLAFFVICLLNFVIKGAYLILNFWICLWAMVEREKRDGAKNAVEDTWAQEDRELRIVGSQENEDHHRQWWWTNIVKTEVGLSFSLYSFFAHFSLTLPTLDIVGSNRGFEQFFQN